MRSRPLLTLLAAALMAAMPVHAVAQEVAEVDRVSVRDRARPDFDPLGVRFGGFVMNASLNLSAASVDNLFATETATQDDVVTRAGAYARLRSNWNRHALEVEAGGQANRYQDFDSEDSEEYYAGLSGRLDVGARSQLSARARSTSAVESRTNPDSLTANAPVEYTFSEVSASAEHRFSRFRVRGTVGQLEYDYDDAGAVDQDFRDNEEQRLTGRVDAELTPRIGLLIEATTDERDYTNLPGLGSEGKTYLAGVTINFTDLMRGEFSAGSFERDYDSGASVEGTALNGNLEWYVTRLTTVSAFASRSVEETGANVALPYVATESGARIDHELRRNLILSAALRRGEREYEGIDRDDTFFGAEIGLDYLLNRRVALNVRYQHDQLESDGANRYRDFDVDVISTGISLRL